MGSFILSGFTSGLILALILLGGGAEANRGLFREYIGAEFKNVKFSNVPINPNVDFHFILAFAIDYSTTTNASGHNSPTNGRFNAFWDEANLSPSDVLAIKALHPNVKFALSLGGDTVGSDFAYFAPDSVSSWVDNAVDSLSSLVARYHLDGIDVDYEHFRAGPKVFATCIGRLVARLKRSRVISFSSIAPFDDPDVQLHYGALWSRYGHEFNYINFQFYAYARGTTVTEFLAHFDAQRRNYGRHGGAKKLLVSFGTDASGGLKPADGFFSACGELKKEGKLVGIFVWSADDSKQDGFIYEKQAQALLAGPGR